MNRPLDVCIRGRCITGDYRADHLPVRYSRKMKMTLSEVLKLDELRSPGMVVGIVIGACLYIALLVLYVLIRSKENDDRNDREPEEKQ